MVRRPSRRAPKSGRSARTLSGSNPTGRRTPGRPPARPHRGRASAPSPALSQTRQAAPGASDAFLGLNQLRGQLSAAATPPVNIRLTSVRDQRIPPPSPRVARSRSSRPRSRDAAGPRGSRSPPACSLGITPPCTQEETAGRSGDLPAVFRSECESLGKLQLQCDDITRNSGDAHKQRLDFRNRLVFGECPASQSHFGKLLTQSAISKNR